MSIEGKFGAKLQYPPNYGFKCPNCGKEILIRVDLSLLPPESGRQEFELRCPHRPCEWEGILTGDDAYPVQSAND